MKVQRKAFTLVELLVVIGIIAVLIGILLPALSRARAQANAVKCASNLKQLYNLSVIYSSMFNNYELPGQAFAGGNAGWWWGTETLGKAMGLKVTDPTNPDYQAVADRIAKIMDCPSNDRPKLPNYNFSVDYVYNENLGGIRGQDPTNGSYASFSQWAFFKKRTQVPENVLVACDAANRYEVFESGGGSSDDRFSIVGELTWKKRQGGSPHGSRDPRKAMGNALFHDGSVRLCRVFSPVNRNDATTYPQPGNKNNPDPDLSKYTDLRDWMIAHPGHAISGATNGVPIEQCWKKGRPLPF